MTLNITMNKTRHLAPQHAA